MNIIKSLPTPLNEQYNLPLYALSSFTLPPTTTIEKLLSAVNTSSELDTIPHSILNKYHIYLASYYQEIIEKSLTSGIFPIYMKTAYVTPIIKKPNLDKSILSNYRPISNLSTLSKTLERFVARQLNYYLHENHILNPNQSAYTKHKSTETAIIHILNHIHLSAASPHGSLSRSINYILHNLRTIRPFININTTAKLLATSLILPRLDYCNSCLYASSQSIINKLQRIQNSAIRFIFNITKYSRHHISPLRTKLHWLPIKSRIIYKIALTIHLATHHNTPDYLANLLTPNTTIYE